VTPPQSRSGVRASEPDVGPARDGPNLDGIMHTTSNTLQPVPSPRVSFAWRGHVVRRASGARGFTLIEVLATLLLMTIALPVIMHGISLATSAGSLAKRRTEAASLTNSKLNELVATGQWQSGQLSGDFGTDWPDYTWSAQLNDYDGTNKQLDVTVNWIGRGGEQEAMTLSTLVYPGNPLSSSSNTLDTGGVGGTQ
jgi:general secretion pathway protein I